MADIERTIDLISVDGTSYIYATTDDLASWLECDVEDLPTDASRLLKRAGELVYAACNRNVLDTTNSDHLVALRDASCAQVEFWNEAGEGLGATASSGTIESYRAGEVSVKYATTSSSSSSSGVGGVGQLCARAALILRVAGLTYLGAMTRP